MRYRNGEPLIAENSTFGAWHNSFFRKKHIDTTVLIDGYLSSGLTAAAILPGQGI